MLFSPSIPQNRIFHAITVSVALFGYQNDGIRRFITITSYVSDAIDISKLPLFTV